MEQLHQMDLLGWILEMWIKVLDKDQLMDLGKEVLSKAMLEMDGKVLLEQGKYMLQH